LEVSDCHNIPLVVFLALLTLWSCPHVCLFSPYLSLYRCVSYFSLSRHDATAEYCVHFHLYSRWYSPKYMYFKSSFTGDISPTAFMSTLYGCYMLPHLRDLDFDDLVSPDSFSDYAMQGVSLANSPQTWDVSSYSSILLLSLCRNDCVRHGRQRVRHDIHVTEHFMEGLALQNRAVRTSEATVRISH